MKVEYREFKTRNYSAGFTLLELIIAIAIFIMLVFVTVAMLQTVLIGSEQGFSAESNIDNGREVTYRFVNEIRNATTGADGSYALNTTNNDQIIFYSQSSNSSTVNRIDYYLSGTTLYKGVVVPTGSPLSYNLGSEVDTPVETNVVNQADNPVFTYYDGNYNGSTSPLAQPINATSVKFVNINLTVLNKVQAQSQASFSVTAGAAIRNLKTNLGD